MAQAIFTRFVGGSAQRPTRISVTAGRNRIIVPFGDEHNDQDRYRRAMQQLCTKLGWEGEYLAGGLPNGDMVWVKVESSVESEDAIIERRKRMLAEALRRV